MYDTVAQYTLDIQAVSCDEMLVDLQDVLQNTSITPEEFAEELRKEMNEKTDCNASVGIGSSILLARVATKKAKPNGVFHLLDGDAQEFFKVRLIKAIETGIIYIDRPSGTCNFCEIPMRNKGLSTNTGPLNCINYHLTRGSK